MKSTVPALIVALAMLEVDAFADCGTPKECFAKAMSSMRNGGAPAEWARLFEAACNGGHGEACLHRGVYETESGAGAEAAQRFHGRACQLNAKEGCQNFGFQHLESGRYGPARIAFIKGCALGLALSCSKLGKIYRLGLGVEKDADAADVYYRQACEGGEDFSCMFVWERTRLGRGSARPDAVAAVALLRRYCNREIWNACGELGWAYFRGDGVAKDVGEGLRLLDVACQHEDQDACHRLARRYSLGEGVPADGARAFEMFARTCAKQHRAACNSLGAEYLEGINVKKDVEKARTLYEWACRMSTATRA
jgi:uncharacterized protein